MKTRHVITGLCAALVLSAGSAFAHDTAEGKGQLGKVSFSTSCDPKVQADFDRAVAMLHSFWYSYGEKAFRDVLAKDPNCAIATWGIAAILMSNPLAGTGASPKGAEQARLAIEQGRKIGAKTQRERDYIEAVAAYYDDWANRPERERQVSRAKAYEALAARYPQDDEAQIFSALYIAGTQTQADQTYSAYLKAAAILEKLFVKHPDHPGVAHYLIHSYDAPPIAAKGLPAARRYAGIAPAAPHALHMPSHIFTRVGEWEASAATNLRSVEAARKGGDSGEGFHASDYAVYAFLQLARDSDAKRTIDEAFKGTNYDPAARGGDSAAAENEAAELARLQKGLEAARDTYWATEVEVQRLTVAGWIALVRGNGLDAVKLMRAAADLEDRNEKSIVTPGRILPARELLGDMLLELKQPAQALKEYESSHAREPNRYRGYAGAARAAEAAGERTKAAHYYAKLMELARNGDAQRPELAHARAYLAQR